MYEITLCILYMMLRAGYKDINVRSAPAKNRNLTLRVPPNNHRGKSVDIDINNISEAINEMMLIHIFFDF